MEAMSSPLAIHAAQDQRCTTEDENGYNLSILFVRLAKKVDKLWCH